MPNPNTDTTDPRGDGPARTHAEAGELLRRPFAPGAIGFRAMTKVTLNGVQYGGRAGRRVPRRPIGRAAAQPRRPRPLATAVHPRPRRAHPDQRAGAGQAVPRLPADDHPPRGGRRPRRRRRVRGRRRDGRRLVRRPEGALLRRAQARRRRRRNRRLPVHRARAGRAADRPRRPAGPGDPPRSGQVRPARDLAATEQWLRQGYEARMDTPAVRRDLGAILAHGEPETGMGQGEAAEANQAAAEATSHHDTPERPAAAQPAPGRTATVW